MHSFQSPFVQKFCSSETHLEISPGASTGSPPPPSLLLRLFEIADVLVRFDDIARLIVNVDHGIM